MGTWGTVFFPIMWESFREWWRWKAEQTGSIEAIQEELYIDDLITDKYFRDNPDIWSPWLIRWSMSATAFRTLYALRNRMVNRFAFDTGAKCLYPNLPGNLSLATNHREKGENYAHSLGPRTITLRGHHVNEWGATPCGEIIYDDEVGNLWHFPSWQDLARWQYDMGLRRPGVGGGHVDSQLVHAKANDVGPLSENEDMSEQHWEMVMSLVEAYVDQRTALLHLEMSPLLRHLRTAHFNRHVLVSSQCTVHPAVPCTSITEVHKCPWKTDISNAQLLVLNARAVLRQNTDMSAFWAGISRISSLSSLEYILLIGQCTGAPTEVSTAFPRELSDCIDDGAEGASATCAAPAERNETSHLTFTLVENVCRETGVDAGASLYRNVRKTSPHWWEKRFGVTKRLAGQLIVKRFVLRRSDYWARRP